MSHNMIISLLVISILFIANSFEVIQSFSSYNISFKDFIKLSCIKIPYLFIEITPLILFFTTIILIQKLNSNNEIFIMFIAGYSFLRMMIIIIITSFILSTIYMTFLHPFATYMLNVNNDYSNKIKNKNKISILKNGIFFVDNGDNEKKIFRASSLDEITNTLFDVSILITENNIPKKLIEAEKIIIHNKKISLYNYKVKKLDIPYKTDFHKVKMSNLDNSNYEQEIHEYSSFDTKINIKDLTGGNIDPKLIYLFKFKNTIKTLKKLRLSYTQHSIYYYKQLFKPLNILSFILLALSFTKLKTRNNNIIKANLIFLIIGVLLYIFSEVSVGIFAQYGILPIISTLLPILLITILSILFILYRKPI